MWFSLEFSIWMNMGSPGLSVHKSERGSCNWAKFQCGLRTNRESQRASGWFKIHHTVASRMARTSAVNSGYSYTKFRCQPGVRTKASGVESGPVRSSKFKNRSMQGKMPRKRLKRAFEEVFDACTKPKTIKIDPVRSNKCQLQALVRTILLSTLLHCL